MPSLEAAAAIRAALNRMYGQRIQVRYYDVAQPEVRAAHADVLNVLHDDHVPLPAILLDNRLLFAGTINPLRVVGAVAQAVQREPSAEQNA